MTDRDHRAGFRDLVAGVEDAGGSWNIMLHDAGRIIGEETGRTSDAEQIWLATCFTALYDHRSALALWCEWPLEDAIDVDEQKLLEPWVRLRREEEGLILKKERHKTHGSSRNLAEGLLDAARWAATVDLEQDDYERLWSQVHEIHKVGRYFGIKLAGQLRYMGLTRARQTDIRPDGAKLGRRTLGMLHPDADPRIADASQTSIEILEKTNRHAEGTKYWLSREQGLDIDYFQLESLLCEYQQMCGGRLYSGGVIDDDYYGRSAVAHTFGEHHPAVVVPDSIGYGTWPNGMAASPRPELKTVWRDHGYVWSDSAYDWEATEDLARPVVRSDGRRMLTCPN